VKPSSPRPLGLALTQYLAGALALAAVTYACIQFSLDLASTAFVYLVLIAVASLAARNFVLSATLAIIAAICLDFLFNPQHRTFRINDFLSTALIMGFLVAALAISAIVIWLFTRPRTTLGPVTREQLRGVLDEIPAQAWSSLPDGAVDFLNRRYLDYTGLTFDQLVGWGWRTAIHPDDTERLLHKWRATLASGKGQETEARLRRHDGVYRWFLFRVEPLRDQHGKVVRWYGVTVDIEDRKRTEEALRRSEAQLEDAQRLSHTGSLTYSPAAGVISWSKETARIYGYDEMSTLTIDKILERVHPDDLDLLKGQIERATRGEPEFDFQHRLRLPDGTVKHVHALGHATTNEAGENEVLGALMDITEQKRVQNALRRSEAYLAEAQRLSRVGSFGWTPSTGTIHWSEESYRIFEFDPNFRVSIERLFSRVHPQDAAAFQEAIERASTGDYDFDFEHRLLMPSGAVKHVHVLSRAIRDNAGHLEIVGAIMDVTATRQAEERLRENEQRFRDYAEVASDWIWETGPDHRFTQISVRLKAAGVDPTSALGMTRWEAAACVEEEPDKWRAHRERLDARLPFRDLRYRLARADGSKLYVTTSGKPRFDAEGRFLGYRGVGTDVTANVRADQAERALQQTQTELAHATRLTTLGQLTASIAHEVNQPLAAIVANGDACLRWLQRTPPDVGKAHDSVQAMISDGNRASDVVRRIRGLAKYSAPHSTLVNVNDVIEEVILLVRREVMSGHVVVKLDLAQDLPPVLFDRVQLQQVIINLVVNSVQAMADNKERPRELLIRSSRSTTDKVHIAVTDTGIGIDPETAKRLFEAFFTTKSTGMGIGLSICRSIIEAKGGRIWATANDGPGATFQFTLTAQCEAAA
jgi:PAS domain S-box-containing protein